MKKGLIIVLIVLVGFFGLLVAFQVYGPFTKTSVQTTETEFLKMVAASDVEKYEVTEDRRVKIFLVEDEVRINKYKHLPGGEKLALKGPHFHFKVVSHDMIVEDMEAFYRENPAIKRVPYVIEGKN